MDKMVADGIITIDADGVVRVTEATWKLMTTYPPEPPAHSAPYHHPPHPTILPSEDD